MPTLDRGYLLATAIAAAITDHTGFTAAARRAPLNPRDKLTAPTISVVCRDSHADPDADRHCVSRRFTVDVAIQQSVRSHADADVETIAEVAAAVAALWEADAAGDPGVLVGAELAQCEFRGLAWAPRVRPDHLFRFALFTSVLSLEYEALQ